MSVRVLHPSPDTTTLAETYGSLDLGADAPAERPYLVTDFVMTVDGGATIDGRSGPIGSDNDLEVLELLRTRGDAVMIGAGTMRVERYGRIASKPEHREARVASGLAADPLAVIVSGRLELPWDAGLFTSGEGEVVVFTTSDEDPPATATSVEIVRHEGAVDLVEAMRHLRLERGIASIVCEGGPHLHGQLLTAGLVDELFLTIAPKLTGGVGPSIVEGLPSIRCELEPVWILEHEGELFTRWRVRAD